MVRSLRGAPPRLTRVLLFLGVVGVLAVGAVAMAAGDDRATTEALLKEVAASPRKDVAEPLSARARAALERSTKLRTAGDEAHAKLADGVARSWAEAARDVARAAAVEESAANTRRAANDAGALADRERAILEESIARSGQLRAQLENAEHEGREQPARTSTAAAKNDAGARPSSKPVAKDGGGAAPAPAASARDGGAR